MTIPIQTRDSSLCYVLLRLQGLPNTVVMLRTQFKGRSQVTVTLIRFVAFKYKCILTVTVMLRTVTVTNCLRKFRSRNKFAPKGSRKL